MRKCPKEWFSILSGIHFGETVESIMFFEQRQKEPACLRALLRRGKQGLSGIFDEIVYNALSSLSHERFRIF